MKKLLLITALITAPLMITTTQAANSSTKITFAKGSYCGNFSGNIRNGKVFSLSLLADQRFVIRNVGDDRVSVAYISGPNGRLNSERYDNETSFFTRRKGNHQIKIYGTSNHSNVEFCAY